ncbi:MAG: patatin-like phospholipase family protein [Verrucomicrobiae bacterium]
MNGPPISASGGDLAVCLASSHLGFQVHAGFLSGLTGMGIRPRHISGASSGAYVGGLYAAGFSPEKIRDILGARTMTRAFWEWRGPLRGLAMLANLGGFTGFLTGKHVARYLEKFLGGMRIEDCPEAELSIAVTNLTKNRAEIVRAGPLKEFIIASCAVPCIFRAYRIGGDLYWDGAVSDSSPFLHLIDDPRIGTIAVHVVVHPDHPPAGRARTISDALGRSHQIVTDRLLELCVERGRRHGKRIVVLTSEVPRFRFGSQKSVAPFFSAGQATAEANRAVLMESAFPPGQTRAGCPG